uniref:mRNA-decapping enzyme 1B n=1 Tax=Cacopsylla melanoneura TaxID=428564 RepID=A0A8D8Y3A0_9HEMI
MAKLTDSEVNVSAIRRVDPLVKDLVDSATHVALYSFNGPKNEWDKTNIEGALFVYKRVGNPLYSMFILNRNSPENLLEPVVKELDLQLQNPFILYKNKQGLIYGIWFYNKEDCERISDILQKLVKELTHDLSVSSKPNVKPKKPIEQMGNGLIMNMLSKAQEEYNSQKSPMRNDQKSRELVSAPQSVMDFFAKAGVSQGVSENHLPQPPGFVPILPRPAASVPVVPEASHPIIQRIMSNPVHSVEHIEKQQRSVTPQGGGTRGKDLPPDVENNMLFMRISDSPIPSQQFFNSNLSQHQVNVDGIEFVESSHIQSALMPPTMFTSSSASKDAGDKLMNGILASDPTPSKHIEPLTKNQIVQAVSHLLKHDADFVNKLHEAYLSSFKDVVST